jgi:hypothetical protein
MREAGNGERHVRKFAIAAILCGALGCSTAEAKTFVAVLWPMFGPLPAIGLVELVTELKMMPDVEVDTYVHQAWPSLVEDIDRQPAGTHTVVVGYSLGANSSVFVANNAKYVDLIIALQPSMLSWNPPLTGKVGRMIEIYNPDPAMTFGGMGSKKLVGDNIEYIANNDSHMGAQFSSQFRDLVKSEIAKFAASDRQETARVATPRPPDVAQPARPASLQPTSLAYAEERPASRSKDVAAHGHRVIARAEMAKPGKPAVPQRVAEQRPKREPQPSAKNPPGERPDFLDTLSLAAASGNLFAERDLTPAVMMDYARRTYGVSGRPDDVEVAASAQVER